ncbi:MAG: formylglycine-generating enzyme family protein [Stenotrophomonas sp.]
MRITWLLGLAGSACTPSSPAPSAQAPQREVVEVPRPEPVQAPLLAPVENKPVWIAPQVQLQPADLPKARRDAARALADDQLYQEADDAIPLYQAILAVQPQDREAKQGLVKARQRLLQKAERLLAQPEDQRKALVQAAELALVATSLAPDNEASSSLQQRVLRSQQVLTFNRAGEEDLRNDRLGGDGGRALANFHAALALEPESSRARQGLAAVESGLIRRAELAASVADFPMAAQWLQKASAIRPGAVTVADARVRIEAMRGAQVAALRDGGLRDLTTPQGLKPAREKLERALRIALPGDAAVAQLRERIDLVSHYGSFRPGQVFTDGLREGGRGPQMIVVPHGGFQMGAGYAEVGASDAERPQHYVRFERGFAMSITEVTVAEFGRFVEATHARPRATRRGHSVVYDERSGNFVRHSGVDWRSDYNGAKAPPNNPVMHISVRDAEAYAAWLSEQTGRYYRLPSEAEFEYAMRAGTSGRYPWGDAGVPPEGTGNFTGSEDVSPSGRHWSNAFIGYGDGFWGAAPVASFRANRWGLHDMGGNVSEWVADCWHSSYRRAPADGAAWYNPGCRQRLVRGGNWANAPEQTRAAWRLAQDSDVTSARIGFRLVRGI